MSSAPSEQAPSGRTWSATVWAVAAGCLLGGAAAVAAQSLDPPAPRAPQEGAAISGQPVSTTLPPPTSSSTRPSSASSSAPATSPSAAGSTTPAEPATVPTLPWLAEKAPQSEADLQQLALSCARGSSDDCLRTGRAYELGLGSPKKPDSARLYYLSGHRLLHEACNKRRPTACHALAHLYAHGLGVAQSTESAKGLVDRARMLCATRSEPGCELLGT